MPRSQPRRTNSTLIATAALALGLLYFAAPAGGDDVPKSARPVAGGYYVGKTEHGRRGTADVSPDRKYVSAAQFRLKCGGQRTYAAIQNMKIRKVDGRFRFSGKGEQALLFAPSYLSEMGTVAVKGRFVKNYKIKGTFRVTSPTCGDSGKIGYELKLKE